MTLQEMVNAGQKLIDDGVDPETPVCVNNKEIYFMAVEPAYWDGCLQKLIEDPSKRPYWSIVGVKITQNGNKVSLNPMGVEDVIADLPDCPVEIDVENHAEEWRERIEKWRKETKEIDREMELGNFR